MLMRHPSFVSMKNLAEHPGKADPTWKMLRILHPSTIR